MPRSHSDTPRTWLITGAGRGLGRAFAQAALDHGDRVVGTVRRAEALEDLIAQFPDSARSIVLDVRDSAAVISGVDAAAEMFGGLDVVVNNAGTGFVGALEEVTEAEARDHFDLNLFGAMWVSRAAIPHLRAGAGGSGAAGSRAGGDIVQISTVGAVGTMPLFGMYNASKSALEAFSEAMAGEVAQFGVRVTIAQLGGFATDWAGSSMPFAAPDPAYDELRTTMFGTSQVPWPGPDPEAPPSDADPSVAAAALLAHLDGPDRPLRVLIGDDAPAHVAAAYAMRRDSYGPRSTFDWPGQVS